MEQRTGILDRKLQMAGEGAPTRKTWLARAEAALKATYGYEFQGAGLLIARVNLLCTTAEFAQAAGHTLTNHNLKTFANIISWNLFQMDGICHCVPFGSAPAQVETPMLPIFAELEEPTDPNPRGRARIFNWDADAPLDFYDLRQKGCPMKFDYIIGNPPYQEETEGTSDTPIYDRFMDASFEVGDRVELISPARFLFDAGKTPKAWNRKMLADPHFKVLHYWQNSQDVFPNNDIKGGIAVTYRDEHQNFGAIEVFAAFDELNSIKEKVVERSDYRSFSDLIYAPESFKLATKLHEEHSDVGDRLSEGHAYDVVTNIFSKLPDIFLTEAPDDGNQYVGFIGLEGTKRITRYVRKDYIRDHPNLEKYKVILPKSNGSGALGEVLSTPLIGEPLIGHTQTFLSIGAFDSQGEAEAAMKYIKTKFARTLLGVLKVTQHNPARTWRYVPLQDFTSASDIDWSKSVADVDAQLYKKYGLTQDEIDFIETHVKEMV